jgi:hypothetical protein
MELNMTTASTPALRRPRREFGSFFAATPAKTGDLIRYVRWHTRTWTATSLYVLPRLASRRQLKRQE